jgi:uncharacterized RDD family membrane protein YckC
MENTLLDYDEILKEDDYRNHLAPKWKRFVNLLIDVYAIQIAFRVFYELYFGENPQGWDDVMVNIYAVRLCMILYFVSEFYTGKTLGKLITGTKVISTEDDKPTAQQILYRTLSRIVPFEPFSIFFSNTTWHDDWSDTVVVNNNFNK